MCTIISLESLVGGKIQSPLTVRCKETYVPEIIRLLAGQKFSLVDEPLSVKSIYSIITTEPYPSDAVFGNTVDTSIIWSTLHRMETQFTGIGTYARP